MQHIYCTECGSKVSYSGPKPKFCSSCGTPIAGSIKTKPEVVVKKTRIPPVSARANSTELKDDETDIDHVPHIDKLSYEAAHEGSGYRTYKFGDIVNVEKEERPESGI